MSEKGWIAASGRPGRMVAVRIEPGSDVINSVIAIIKSNGFKSGTVTGIGSLNSATVIWGRTTDISLPKEEATVTYDMEGPVELGIGWGVFGTQITQIGYLPYRLGHSGSLTYVKRQMPVGTQPGCKQMLFLI